MSLSSLPRLSGRIPAPHDLIGKAIANTGRVSGLDLRRSLHRTTVAWLFGAFWMAAVGGSTQTRLGEWLGADDAKFGWLGAAPQAGLLLAVPGTLVLQWLGKRKAFFVWTVTVHRLLYVLIGLLPWIYPHKAGALVMVALLLVSNGLNAFGGQAWVHWMADLVPTRVRGKYFARRSRYGIGVMLLTGVAVGALLDVGQFPWFGKHLGPIADACHMSPLVLMISVLFMVAGLVGSLDILTFLGVDDPPMESTKISEFWKTLSAPLRDDQFMRYCYYYAAWTFAVIWCQVFWYVLLLRFFDDQTASGAKIWWSDWKYLAAAVVLAVSYQIGQFLGYPIWGRAVDKFGRKPALFVSSTLHSLSWLPWIFISPALLPWLCLTQIYGGLVGGGQDIASFNMMLRFNRKGGSAYQAVGTVLFALAGFVSAVSAGWLMKHLQWVDYQFLVGTPWTFTFNRYGILILTGALMKYAADFLLLPLIQDWHDKPAEHTMRFVLDSVYGNLNQYVLVPLLSVPTEARRHLRRVRDLVRNREG